MADENGRDNVDGPEQGALFQIEGPDEDCCVWICPSAGRDAWCQNLGLRDAAAEMLADWLAAIDFDG